MLNRSEPLLVFPATVIASFHRAYVGKQIGWTQDAPFFA